MSARWAAINSSTHRPGANALASAGMRFTMASILAFVVVAVASSAVAAIPLVVVVSEHYVPGAENAIASVRRVVPLYFEPHLLVLSDDDARAVRDRWTSILPPIRVANCSGGIVTNGWRDAPARYRYLRASPHIWLRTCIVDTYPEWGDTVLWYLDADTELQPDFVPPCATLEPTTAAVCAVWNRERTQLNSGVLRINTTAWRRGNWSKRIATHMRDDPRANDQQVLTRVALDTGDVCALDPRYNVMGLGERRHMRKTPRGGYIWHWTGPHKPWQY